MIFFYNATPSRLQTAIAGGLSLMLLASTAVADPQHGQDDTPNGQQQPHANASPHPMQMHPIQQQPHTHPANRPTAQQTPHQVAPPTRQAQVHRVDNPDNQRDNGQDRNNHRHGPDYVEHVDNGAYYRSAPYYSRVPYYGYGLHHQYYYSSYYAQRIIPVETAQPYVEVRCTSLTPITGTIVGGVAGGLVGSQFGNGYNRAASTVGGALLGAILGQAVDQTDESCAYQSLEYAEPNTQVVWASPDQNYSYTMIPGPVDVENGQYCREYQAKILVGNDLQDGYGRACRQPDGSWQVAN